MFLTLGVTLNRTVVVGIAVDTVVADHNKGHKQAVVGYTSALEAQVLEVQVFGKYMCKFFH